MTSPASAVTSPPVRAVEDAAPTRANGSLLHTLLGMEVLGLGSYLPETIVDNDQLASAGFDSEWIIQRTGIRERRHAPSHLATSDLATEAARRALDRAGRKAEEIDLIVMATMTPDMQCPSTACIVQKQLGAHCPAMDLQAACSGFMYALATAAQFVHSKACRLALVVGAETMSRTVSARDMKTYPLFGDGAGAALLGPGTAEQGLLSYSLGADGRIGDVLEIPVGGSREPLTPQNYDEHRQYLTMDGRAVFKWAVRIAAESCRQVLDHAKLAIGDIDHVIFHQANLRILDAVAGELGVAPPQMAMNLDRVGNTSAASIPLVLDELATAGRLDRGDKVLLCGFGAGLTWGTAILRW